MMNINSLGHTTLLPQEAADTLAKARQGTNPSLPSQVVTSIEPIEKSAQHAGHKQNSAAQDNTGNFVDSANNDKPNKSAKGSSPTNNEVGQKAATEKVAQTTEKPLTAGQGGLNSKDESAAKVSPAVEGPQLQLLKRQLVAKRSLARQIYLNTLETKVVDNVGSGIKRFGEGADVAEVTETLNSYAQIIRRDLTFSQQEGNTNVAIHDRNTGELVRTISSEEALELSGDLDHFKTGHLLEIRA